MPLPYAAAFALAEAARFSALLAFFLSLCFCLKSSGKGHNGKCFFLHIRHVVMGLEEAALADGGQSEDSAFLLTAEVSLPASMP